MTEAEISENLFSSFEQIFPYEKLGLAPGETELGVEYLFTLILDALKNGIRESLPVLSTLLSICILTVLISYFSFDEKGRAMAESAAMTFFALAIYAQLKPVLSSLYLSLSALLEFTAALGPVLSAVMLAFGNTASAGSEALSMTLVTSFISLIIENVLMPLSCAVFVFAMASAASEREASKLVKTLKNTFFTIFGTLMALLISSLALQNTLAASKDSAYLRTARQMMGGMIPVVGTALSSSLSSLISAFGYIKGVFGVLSIAFILSIFIPTLLSLLFVRLSFSLSASFMEFSSMPGGVRVFSAFLAGIDTLLGLFVMSFLSVIFALVFFMKGGANLAW